MHRTTGETAYHWAVDPASAGLVLQGVSAGYGDGMVLSDVELAIEPGSIVGIIGPNGSGKSTLLKAILGLTPIRSGRVELDGRPVDKQRRRVAYVPQREAVDGASRSTRPRS